jgi:8-oxo-dGTP pyrophosphatase MutT (NUDIX family)
MYFCIARVTLAWTIVPRMPDMPNEPLNLDGEPVKPRQAATVIVLQGGADALEVLLVQRNPEQRFMGGAWVFPGGAVDTEDGDDDDQHRVAGVREVAEEAGLTLPDRHALISYSRWITPAVVAMRFDTHFFLARAPAGQKPVVDGYECVAWAWWNPGEAIKANARNELLLAFPTIKTLEGLARFENADELLRWADGRTVEAVEPRVVVEGEVSRIVLPGEPGYAD